MTSTRSTIPPLLESYLRLPPETSLILLTGTLGCSVSWLVSRFVGAVLHPGTEDGFGGAGAGAGGSRGGRYGAGGRGGGGGEGGGVGGGGHGLGRGDDEDGARGREDWDGRADESGRGVDVVLVSWMRDLAFWKSEIRRGGGVDITKLMKKDADADENESSGGRFTFVDCFTTLSSLPQNDEDALLAELETRITAAITSQRPSPTQHQTNTRRRRKTFLILDSPSLLPALSLLTSLNLSTLLLRLRALPEIHSTLLTCPSDLPLLSAATPHTPTGPGRSEQQHQSAGASAVEVESAAFVVQQAGVARCVIGVRELETGAAGDVSGVLRVSRGGGGYADGCEEWEGEGGSGEKEGAGEEVKEMEVLYLVRRDGSARVFERGADGL
ncbi:hypothetical protein LTR91_003975 [Friedmanniomyces endolithicus]|uniref:Uncharacterized protein n=1 Tax=Friedmanniomyces endolithicus TaxID=329885 RepID=A0AAN6KWX9_9PEZI|nr:hypothetical protein LTR35_010453 [Friedmanniomyces endolithicus]KAK0294173.1 hypothetical protein LTS00_007147 [Friedmanniomyces endolithicus]KAK0315126.1 hypothetical protein LTR82_012684 [Friedmanniomyces endolithicus]KAK0916990.1 hypothetical protein LTR57_012713 [Friedmanniomyces endolithicus]KAK0968505.1 hypothetical protein LTS01_016704 [Friedmanniomyces endolithicus]